MSSLIVNFLLSVVLESFFETFLFTMGCTMAVFVFYERFFAKGTEIAFCKP